jgi:hypothetical protein
MINMYYATSFISEGQELRSDLLGGSGWGPIQDCSLLMTWQGLDDPFLKWLTRMVVRGLRICPDGPLHKAAHNMAAVLPMNKWSKKVTSQEVFLLFDDLTLWYTATFAGFHWSHGSILTPYRRRLHTGIYIRRQRLLETISEIGYFFFINTTLLHPHKISKERLLLSSFTEEMTKAQGGFETSSLSLYLLSWAKAL